MTDIVYLSDDESRLIQRSLLSLSVDLERESLRVSSHANRVLARDSLALETLAGKLDGATFYGEVKLPGWVGINGQPIDSDHCWCGRKIGDQDPHGTEAESGQRYCTNHLPAGVTA